MPYVIDSDVLIDVSRGKLPARDFVNALPEGWAISKVTALELMVGARDKQDFAGIDRFLSQYVIVPLRDSIGARAYDLVKRYSKSHGLHVFDSPIAATAMEEALTLVTGNQRHFGINDGLSLLIPVY
jgi:predicted nucleic acid-binding protein